ncbi:galactose mutarotase-like domain-containing protein [Pelagophyceae sp. CCMP2097]|nr:galactose mutarotase-like domain-containing protein [Pelagophyceae sp. CCMP2097]|mmetsp:Transcript_11688/g.39083  ORF Transcript_11688/g.39083 Transcript_11688/m.39083 type:complete len:326 (+) Transcript_11688:51-1028(+)
MRSARLLFSGLAAAAAFQAPQRRGRRASTTLSALPPQTTLQRKDGLASLSFYASVGHVTSWVCQGEEQLFLSEKATFVPGKSAIRGGIPICWPAFNDRHLPAGKHGIVRTSDKWTAEAFDGEDPFVVLNHPTVYFDVSETKEISGYHFDEPAGVSVPADLSLKVTLFPSSLRIDMTVVNLGESDFRFSTVLHNYFSVNAMPVTVKGFQGLSGLKDGLPFTDPAENVIVEGQTETQRLYATSKAISWETSAAKGGLKKLTMTKSENLPDVVLWNVGAENAASMSDLHTGGDQRYVCVEAGICASPDAVVPAGGTWSGWQDVAVTTA